MEQAGRQRRLFIVMCMMACMLIVILLRLFWIQAQSERYGQAAVKQRYAGLVIDSGRAHLYDRTGLSLTGQVIQALAVYPKWYAQLPERAAADADQRIAEILGVTPEQWRQTWTASTEPFFWAAHRQAIPEAIDAAQAKLLEDAQIPGVVVTPYVRRYQAPYLAAHLLGYLGQHPERLLAASNGQELTWAQQTRQMGGSGLEASLDRQMQSVGATELRFYSDGVSRRLRGLDVRVHQEELARYPLRVMTTLDSNIQRTVEELMDRYGVERGATVVLDARNGDIRAMASRPQMDPYALDPTLGQGRNLALTAAAPGSIFKTVIAAAALETGKARWNERFSCSGSYGRYGLHCWLHSGHGTLTFAEAFAQSCNVSFAQLGERLSAEEMARTARQFGLLAPVGWHSTAPVQGERFALSAQLDGEQSGQLFAASTPASDGGVRAQTAIGQRDVRMTPLQAATMVLTLLHDGQVLRPRAVSELRYQTGDAAMRYKVQSVRPADGRLSPRTCALLRRWMREVVQHGTGRRLQEAVWPLAGKSGTAQTDDQSGTRENQWFTGFGPYGAPEYVVAVLVQRNKEGGPHLATDVFGGIMDALAAMSEG